MNKEEQMRALFDEWRASGKPRTTFARERGLPINTFHYWCQRFEGKRPRSGDRNAATNLSPTFVEISQPTTTVSPEHQPRMRFELPDGTSITVF
jgi:hypothetical protein